MLTRSKRRHEMALIVRPTGSHSNHTEGQEVQETTQLKQAPANLHPIQLQHTANYNQPLQEQGMLSPQAVYLGNIEDHNVRPKQVMKETPNTTECSTQLTGYQPGASGLVQPGLPGPQLSRQTNQSGSRAEKSPEKDAQMKDYIQRNAYYFTGKVKAESMDTEPKKPPQQTVQSEVIDPAGGSPHQQFYGPGKSAQKRENLAREQGFHFESQLA